MASEELPVCDPRAVVLNQMQEMTMTLVLKLANLTQVTAVTATLKACQLSADFNADHVLADVDHVLAKTAFVQQGPWFGSFVLHFIRERLFTLS